MSEWKRLTPGKRSVADAFWMQRGNGLHELKGSAEHITLDDPEALAFTIATGKWRDVPEVRALVKIARFILKDATVNQDGYARLERGCDEQLRDALDALEVDADV